MNSNIQGGQHPVDHIRAVLREVCGRCPSFLAAVILPIAAITGQTARAQSITVTGGSDAIAVNPEGPD